MKKLIPQRMASHSIVPQQCQSSYHSSENNDDEHSIEEIVEESMQGMNTSGLYIFYESTSQISIK